MIIDGHLDLAWNALTLQRVLTDPIAKIRESELPEPWHNEGAAMVSLPEMQRGNINIAFATVFAQPAGDSPTARSGYTNPEEAYNIAIQQIKWYENMENTGQIKIIRTLNDLENAVYNTQINLMLLMEGADPLRTVDDLDEFIDRGIRAIGPAWRETRYSGGAGTPGPLTNEGRNLIRKMGKMNIALDLSHLSDLAIDEAIDIHAGPLFASHSNCRSITMRDIDITPSSMYEKIAERQVDDRIIEKIAARRGTVGLVMYNPFIDAKWDSTKELLSISALMPHINHIKQIGGTETLSIGSDLDGGVGVETTPEELDSIADLHKIPEMMIDNNFTQEEVNAVKHDNLMRLMRMILY